MSRQNILQIFLFVVFFSIGAAALSVSILCNDLLRYYRNKHLLGTAQQALERLESLNADYDALLRQLANDPNYLNRISHAVIGAGHEEEDTTYPRLTPAQLNAARKALTEVASEQTTDPVVPSWLKRASQSRRRAALFMSGAALILISFMLFGSAKQAGG
jgi:hypothetical protein